MLPLLFFTPTVKFADVFPVTFFIAGDTLMRAVGSAMIVALPLKLTR
jgi:hypothetical protein